jgi:hypothetical protein
VAAPSLSSRHEQGQEDLSVVQARGDEHGAGGRAGDGAEAGDPGGPAGAGGADRRGIEGGRQDGEAGADGVGEHAQHKDQDSENERVRRGERDEHEHDPGPAHRDGNHAVRPEPVHQPADHEVPDRAAGLQQQPHRRGGGQREADIGHQNGQPAVHQVHDEERAHEPDPDCDRAQPETIGHQPGDRDLGGDSGFVKREPSVRGEPLGHDPVHQRDQLTLACGLAGEELR